MVCDAVIDDEDDTVNRKRGFTNHGRTTFEIDGIKVVITAVIKSSRHESLVAPEDTESWTVSIDKY